MIRYTLRPPIAADRLRLTPEGQVLLERKRPWPDGTTHLAFDPTELLERLAAITPRPRINLVLYYGVLGARSAWRAQVVPGPPRGEASEALDDARPSSYLWAHLPVGQRWGPCVVKRRGHCTLPDFRSASRGARRRRAA